MGDSDVTEVQVVVDPGSFTDQDWLDIATHLGVTVQQLGSLDAHKPELVAELVVACFWVAGRKVVPGFTVEDAAQVTMAEIAPGDPPADLLAEVAPDPALAAAVT